MKKLLLTLLFVFMTSIACWAIDIDLSWDAPDDTRVTGYNVFYGVENPPTTMITSTDTTVRITNLENGIRYHFGVKSTAGTKESIMSNILSQIIGEESEVIWVPGQVKELRIIMVPPVTP